MESRCAGGKEKEEMRQCVCHLGKPVDRRTNLLMKKAKLELLKTKNVAMMKMKFGAIGVHGILTVYMQKILLI